MTGVTGGPALTVAPKNKTTTTATTTTTTKINYNCVNVVKNKQLYSRKSRDCKLRLNAATEQEETTASGREFQAIYDTITN